MHTEMMMKENSKRVSHKNLCKVGESSMVGLGGVVFGTRKGNDDDHHRIE